MEKKRTSREFIAMEMPEDFDLSDERKAVLDALEHTRQNIFLTGKAGTGKSQLLKYFRATTRKKIAVLAPTGVAAVNVQGQTWHSFLKWHGDFRAAKKLSIEEAKVFRELDMVIIDEISMVRADHLDYIDHFLRLNRVARDLPFGDVQMLLMGDPFQLPPVVPDDLKEALKSLYPSEHFFDSGAYISGNFQKFELVKNYRQRNEKKSDRKFIEALDAFRTASFDEAHLAHINTRAVKQKKHKAAISVVSRNKMADDINTEELAKLDTPAKVYQGIILDKFKEKDLPTAFDLVLKVGAQVMLLNNDPQKRWINGDIVEVIRTEDSYIRVRFDDGSYADIGPNKWESVQFSFDEENKSVRPEVTGSFSQLPVKLAWAITIHKSQGQTFDNVRIHFGTGAFAAGQAYVALSRSRTLEGIVLAHPVKSSDIFADDRIKTFMGSDFAA
jgi:ATP-dependent exoDNAse (exonuclease V) alpha subunit